MNNTSYVQDQTLRQIIKHLREIRKFSEDKRNMLDFNEHVEELLSRINDDTILTSRRILLASLNTVDRSRDTTLESDPCFTVSYQDLVGELKRREK